MLQQIPCKAPFLFPPIFFCVHNPTLWLHHPCSLGNLLNQEEEYLRFVLLPATETVKVQSQTGHGAIFQLQWLTLNKLGFSNSTAAAPAESKGPN